jgi:hypothetical protein
MEKTSVYLPPELKKALKSLARQRNCSEAELLREAVSVLTQGIDAPAPRLPLFRTKGPSIAETIDDELSRGFGR